MNSKKQAELINLRELKDTDLEFLFHLLTDEEIINNLNCKIANTIDELIEIYNQYWKKDIDEIHYIISLENKDVGWLKLNGLDNTDILWISELVILPDYQNKGIGTFVLSFTEKYGLRKSYNKIGLHTQENNKRAVSFYLKNEYKIIKEKIVEIKGDKIKDYTLIKELNK
jgi:GNAT superfamily N-acetyltransferase